MILKIQCVVTCQWLKLHLKIFHTFYTNFHMFYTNSLPSKLSTVQESSCRGSAVLDSFYLYQASSIMGGWQVPEVGKMVTLRF